MNLTARTRLGLVFFAVGTLALLGLGGCADDEQNTQAMQQLPWDSPTAATSGMAGIGMGQQGPQVFRPGSGKQTGVIGFFMPNSANANVRDGPVPDGPLAPTLQAPAAGTLYVVSTPIGHLGDLSPRAAHLLRECDIVASEDTRVTRALLTHVGSHRPLVSYHDHREEQQAGQLLEKLRGGQSVALVSDAGTPNVSDPGFRLVRACRRAGLPIVPVPGPSALLAALCASGLPTHGFLFAGFLPPKSAARQKFLTKHKDFEYTIILYESCHRIAALAADMNAVLGPRRLVCIAREVTKKFETFLVGPVGEMPARLTGDNLRGEFTVVIAPEGYEL